MARSGLELRDVTITASARAILRHVTLEVHPGSVLVITGPAEDRQTVLATIAGLRPPSAGRVLLSGHEVHQDMVGREIGYAPQIPSVVGILTAIENVALIQMAQDIPRADAWAASVRHLSMLGLPQALLDTLAEDLSAGQRQRLSFARATIGHPRLLVADDPTDEQDPDTAARFLTIIHDLAGRDTAVVLSTTDPALASMRSQTLRLIS